MMEIPKSTALVARSWIAAASAAASVLIGGLVLGGWVLGFPDLTELDSGAVTLKPNAALCFLLYGVAMVLLLLPGQLCARVARICAVILGGIAVLTLAEYATGRDLGIDGILMRDFGREPAGAHPRMGPYTVLSFLFTAAALWLMSGRGGNPNRPMILAWLGSLVLAIGLFVGLGQMDLLTAGWDRWNLTRAGIFVMPLFVLAASAWLVIAWRESGERWLIERWITVGFVAGQALLVVGTVHSWSIPDPAFELLPIGTVLSLVLLTTGMFRLNRVMGARQRGDEALQRSGRLLRLALEAAEIGEWELDLVTLTMRRSPRFDQVFGYSKVTPTPEWSYELFLEHVHPADRARVDRMCQDSLTTGRDWAFECRVVRQDGSAGWIWARGAAVKNESGKLVEMLGMVRDITGQKNTEAELRLTTDRFQRALKNSPITVFNQDLDLRYTWIYNPALDYESTEVIGSSDADLFERAEDAVVTEAIKNEVIRTGVGRREEVLIRSQGVDRYYDMVVDPLLDAGGIIAGVTCVVVEITQRKHAEVALHKSEAAERARRRELEALMDAIPVAILISRNADNQQMTANRAAEELLRLPHGRNPSQSGPDGDRPDFQVWADGRQLMPEELPMQRATATGQAVSGAEIEIVFPDGERKSVLSSAYPLFDESGAVRGCICADVDIRVRKRRELNVAFLAEMQMALATITRPLEIMSETCRRISEHLQLDHCLFVEINKAADQATVLFDHHAGDGTGLPGICSLSDFHTEDELREMAAGRMVVIDNTREFPFSVERRDRFKALGIGSLANASYVVTDRWKFVLSAIRHEPGEWSPEDTWLLAELVERLHLRLEGARAEERLLESEARFRSIFHEAAVPMEVSMPDGRFAQVNRAFCELLGYSEAELLATTFDAITYPEEQKSLALEPLRDLMEGKSNAFRAEKRYIRKDGMVVWVDLSVSVVRDVGGKPLYFIGQVQDITGRKRAESSLRKSENMLALAVEAGQLGIWNWDQLTRTLVWSERCNEMAGLPRGSDITMETAIETVHPEERGHVMDEAKLSIKKGADIELEYRTLWPDGTVRWLQTRGRAIYDAANNLVRITGVSQDVTERRESEEALRRFNTKLESLVDERTEVIKMTMKELQREFAERRRLEEEILEIGERAQSRIGQDLHDDLGQQLVGMTILMGLLSGQLAAESHPQAAEADRLQSFLTGIISTTRNLAKSLYPVELERGGLIISLQELANRTGLLAGVTCKVNADLAFKFEKATEIHLYRIVQESISNALKHGKARNIVIDCTVRRGVSTLTVTDDGSGFEPPEAGQRAGIGLHLFQYRARLIGAKLTVTRGDKGGCQVRCSIAEPTHSGDRSLQT